jgi:hypothetical protein
LGGGNHEWDFVVWLFIAGGARKEETLKGFKLGEEYMDQMQFASKFSSIQAKLSNSSNYYKFKTVEDVWKNIGTNPLDIAIIELTNLYLESDNIQREFIFNHFTSNELLNDLWYFVRRIGKQINAKDDSKYLELGIAASLIDGGRADFRDLIVSITLLRFAAEIRDIDTRPYFDQALQNANERMKSILASVRDEKESGLHYTVQTFGSPDWVSASIKKYGKHPLSTTK